MAKFRQILSLILCVALIVLFPLTTNAATDHIVLIDSPQDLISLSKNCRVDDYSKNLTVVLSADIDMSGITFSPIPVFNGIFRGNGHTITGLSMVPKGSQQGFFRSLTASAVVSDLHLEGTVHPEGSACDIGAIAGINGGKIENCSFRGNLTGMDRIGGIAGVNTLTGVIDNCSVYGIIYGNHFTGGISGENAGVIRGCTNYAMVNTTAEQNTVSLQDITLESLSGTEYAATVTDIGGICGTGTGLIRDCQNLGDIGYPKIGYNIGGIAGSYSGYITGSSNQGQIHGRKEIGGIVGQLEPAVKILYAEDTVQTLQQQLNEMAGTAGSAGNHIQSGTDALGNLSSSLDAQIENAKDALDLLTPDPENPEMPDEDTLEAARNALSSSISGITGALNTMVSSSMDVLGGLANDIQSLTGQMNAIGSTLGAASENMGGSISDISDADTPTDLSSKLENCRNSGTVSGEWNVGGIVGAVAPENDLDPESDLQLIGNSSLNVDIQLRAVILDCENRAVVACTKQNGGGIAGWASMGLIKRCMNTAQLDAASANYVGGIAGRSHGYIRASNAKCTLSGSTYVGGVAGAGNVVSDCRTIVHLDTPLENAGGILGILNDADLSGNFCMVTGAEYDAIDGISYVGAAQCLEASQFFALADLPANFRLVDVRFLYQDGTEVTHSLPYGCAISVIDFPELQKMDGYDARWEGPASKDDPAVQDITFTASYIPHVYTLDSDLKASEGKPVFLIQGEFVEGSVFTAQSVSSDTNSAAWNFTIPQSEVPVTMRCLLPESMRSGDISVQLLLDDGSKQDVQTNTAGSYLIFAIPENAVGLWLTHTPQDYTLLIIVCVGFAVLLTAAVFLLVLRKKKKSK